MTSVDVCNVMAVREREEVALLLFFVEVMDCMRRVFVSV